MKKIFLFLLISSLSVFASFFVVDKGRIVEIVNEPSSSVEIIGSNGRVLKKHKTLYSAKRSKLKHKYKKRYKKRRVSKKRKSYKKYYHKKRRVVKKRYRKTKYSRKYHKKRKYKKVTHKSKKRKKIRDMIVIRTSKRWLEFYRNGRFYKIYPVAVGKTGWKVYGNFWVRKKVKWPDWIPTKRLKEENPNLPDIVYGGPKNPLGARALYLGYSAIRIHGTNNPSSVGKASSHGCFRMKNKDVIELYNMVKIGTPVYIK